MAPNDRARCIAAMARDGLAGDASLSGDHPSNDKRGCDVVQGCRVDRKEDDGKEDHRKEDDGKEDHREEVDREEDHREEVDREEVDREEVDREEDDRVYDGGEEAGCRLELVAAGRVIPVSCTRRVLELLVLELLVLGTKARTCRHNRSPSSGGISPGPVRTLRTPRVPDRNSRRVPVA